MSSPASSVRRDAAGVLRPGTPTVPGADPTVWSLIVRKAEKYGVDPRAALAVALGEGGIRWGSVGDGGTSFGPFQLHIGGALPEGRDAAWANSPAGIDYAIRKIAESGARGLTGQDAVNAIVRNFERPANPTASASRAWRHYQRIGNVTAGTNPTPSASDGVAQPIGFLGPIPGGILGGGGGTYKAEEKAAGWVEDKMGEIAAGIVRGLIYLGLTGIGAYAILKGLSAALGAQGPGDLARGAVAIVRPPARAQEPSGQSDDIPF